MPSFKKAAIGAVLSLSSLTAAFAQPAEKTLINAEDGFKETPLCVPPQIMQNWLKREKLVDTNLRAQSPRFQLEVHVRKEKDGTINENNWALIGVQGDKYCRLLSGSLDKYTNAVWFERYFGAKPNQVAATPPVMNIR